MTKVISLHNQKEQTFEMKMLELENKTRIARANATISARTRRTTLLEQRHEQRMEPIHHALDTMMQTVDSLSEYDTQVRIIKKSKLATKIIGFFFDLEQ